VFFSIVPALILLFAGSHCAPRTLGHKFFLALRRNLRDIRIRRSARERDRLFRFTR
jgi:hypothetical protein